MAKLRKFLRWLFISKKEDNSSTIGFGAFVIAAIVIFGLVYLGLQNLFKKRESSSTSPRQQQSQRISKVEIERAAASGANDQPVTALQQSDDNPLTISVRGTGTQEAPKAPVSAESKEQSSLLDTVQMAANPKSEGSHGHSVDEGGGGLSAERVRGGSAQQADPEEGGTSLYGKRIPVTQNSAGASGSLTIYTGDPIDPKHTSVTKPPASTTKIKVGFETGNFLPKGTEFWVRFDSRVQTLDLEGLVRLTVIGHVRSPDGRIQIPDGSLIFGTAAKNNIRGRVAVSVQSIIFPDTGREIGMSGILKDEDGQPGVVGVYHPGSKASDAISYLSPLAIGYLESRKDTTNGAYGIQANPFSAKNSAIDATIVGLGDQLRKKQTELEELYKAYVEIGKGTLAKVQIIHALDMEKSENSKPDDTPALSPMKSLELLNKIETKKAADQKIP